MTCNQAFYRDLMERLRKRVQRVQPDIADDWVLHHDNAPAHITYIATLKHNDQSIWKPIKSTKRPRLHLPPIRKNGTWGFVKGNVFLTPVPDISNLKARITDAFATTTEDMLENMWRETDYRLDLRIFSFWWYPWCVSAGRVALIRDNKMANEPQIEAKNLTFGEETVYLLVS